jgi:hypothetical protein
MNLSAFPTFADPASTASSTAAFTERGASSNAAVGDGTKGPGNFDTIFSGVANPARPTGTEATAETATPSGARSAPSLIRRAGKSDPASDYEGEDGAFAQVLGSVAAPVPTPLPGDITVSHLEEGAGREEGVASFAAGTQPVVTRGPGVIPTVIQTATCPDATTTSVRPAIRSGSTGIDRVSNAAARAETSFGIDSAVPEVKFGPRTIPGLSELGRPAAFEAANTSRAAATPLASEGSGAARAAFAATSTVAAVSLPQGEDTATFSRPDDPAASIGGAMTAEPPASLNGLAADPQPGPVNDGGNDAPRDAALPHESVRAGANLTGTSGAAGNGDYTELGDSREASLGRSEQATVVTAQAADTRKIGRSEVGRLRTAEKLSPGAEHASEEAGRESEDAFKQSLSPTGQAVAQHRAIVGTASAKYVASMPADTFSPPAQSAFTAQGELSMQVEGAAGEPLPTPSETISSAAHQAVESILSLAEQVASGERQSVNLKFSIGGADLQVRVGLWGDEVRTTFSTESSELRTALAEEWQNVIATADRGVRLADPVFSRAGEPGTAGFSSDTASQQQQRDSAARREMFSAPAAFGRVPGSTLQSNHSSEIAPPHATRAASPSQRLHTFA